MQNFPAPGCSDTPLPDSLLSPSVNPYLRAVTRLGLVMKRPLLRRRVSKPIIEHVLGRSFLVLPQVLNPVVFRSGRLLAEFVATSSLMREFRPHPGAEPGTATVLDMGTGSGICAVFAAAAGFRVIGVDVNHSAVRCARINALLNALDDRIEIREGDLFAPLRNERFDIVLFNPPFFRGFPTPGFDQAWRGTDVIERFASGVSAVLTDRGRAFVLVSTDGDRPNTDEVLSRSGFALQVLCRKHYGNEIMTIYDVTRG